MIRRSLLDQFGLYEMLYGHGQDHVSGFIIDNKSALLRALFGLYTRRLISTIILREWNNRKSRWKLNIVDCKSFSWPR